MGRILGVDFGSRRVGLALTDTHKIMAFPHKTLVYSALEELIEELRKEIGEQKVETVVVGLPIGMRGQQTDQTVRVEEFVSELKRRISVPVRMVDERLTSVQAERVLRERGLEPSRHKSRVDKTAAAIFLQSYLDSQSTP